MKVQLCREFKVDTRNEEQGSRRYRQPAAYRLLNFCGRNARDKGLERFCIYVCVQKVHTWSDKRFLWLSLTSSLSRFQQTTPWIQEKHRAACSAELITNDKWYLYEIRASFFFPFAARYIIYVHLIFLFYVKIKKMLWNKKQNCATVLAQKAKVS